MNTKTWAQSVCLILPAIRIWNSNAKRVFQKCTISKCLVTKFWLFLNDFGDNRYFHVFSGSPSWDWSFKFWWREERDRRSGLIHNSSTSKLWHSKPKITILLVPELQSSAIGITYFCPKLFSLLIRSHRKSNFENRTSFALSTYLRKLRTSFTHTKYLRKLFVKMSATMITYFWPKLFSLFIRSHRKSNFKNRTSLAHFTQIT